MVTCGEWVDTENESFVCKKPYGHSGDHETYFFGTTYSQEDVKVRVTWERKKE